MSYSRFDSTELKGGWKCVSVWTLPWYLTVHPLRQQVGGNADVSEEKCPSTYVFLPLNGKYTLLLNIENVRLHICVDHWHVQNTMGPLYAHVLDQKVALIFRICQRTQWVIGWAVDGRWGPPTLDDATWFYEGVVVNVWGSEGLAFQVRNLVTYSIVTRNDKATLITI